ncbi:MULTISPECIES: cation diffusion facilitator family transporter [unclassified Alcanivorax]|jgi:ferrous-iron efflux pump FieF|uniref:cation diffusion facilitator family transporter n=1 Tax=unclassified Alcanivorax TaxID=2638842 RepID=UPI00017ECBF7|nr:MULTISPECIES: cation diffusion facilitator family transporter [unclassified Alcanivorax]EDX88867.1 cation efflux family protein [Alcanivorax sp. DG881]
MRRDDRREHRLLLVAGLASVLTALILIAAKAIAWLMTGSVSLLASLVDSVMDSIASLINFFAIRYSLVPADEEHRFGHGKAEALAGLGQAVFIAGSSVFLIHQSVTKLMDPQPISENGAGVAVMLFSIVLTFGLLLIQKYVVRETGSTAIEADSLHYLSDLAVNVGIIVVLVVSQFGYLWLDGVVGLVIAVFILFSAWHIAYESAQLLLDREIPGEVREVITAIVADHPQALGFHDLRTRQSGRTQFIQLHVDMDQNLTLLQAHDLATRIETRIQEAFPMADVIIHQDPVAVGPKVTLDDRPPT